MTIAWRPRLFFAFFLFSPRAAVYVEGIFLANKKPGKYIREKPKLRYLVFFEKYEPPKKTLITFHYTGWFIGILIMVYNNPYITGKFFIPYITQPTRGPFFVVQNFFGGRKNDTFSASVFDWFGKSEGK